MTLATILRFQIGDAAAIRTVASSRVAVPAGIVLVLMAAVARNYDQTHISETPLWLFGSLLFSFFSGTFLFVVLYNGFIRRNLPDDAAPEPWFVPWWRFMGLFWMTAPVAWLYAIPVERFLASLQAAQANLALLGIVAFWRVLLMSRVLAVLLGVRLRRALAWVLIPASLEVLAVVFFGMLFSPTFGRKVMASMSGMRNSPEEDLLMGGVGHAFTGALVTFLLVVVALAIWDFGGKLRGFPPRENRGGFPIVGLSLLTAFWVAVAIPAQMEQRNYLNHAALVQEGRYRESIDYLARHEPSGFPAARRLEPDPYEHRVFEALPEIVAVLRPSDPAWVLQLHLRKLEAMLSHFRVAVDADAHSRMLEALERIPEANAWLEEHRERLTTIGGNSKEGEGGTP